MTSIENLVLTTTVKRVNYYLEQGFDKYVIDDYIDSIIRLSRIKYSEDLLTHLIDIRQKVLLNKKI